METKRIDPSQCRIQLMRTHQEHLLIGGFEIVPDDNDLQFWRAGNEEHWSWQTPFSSNRREKKPSYVVAAYINAKLGTCDALLIQRTPHTPNSEKTPPWSENEWYRDIIPRTRGLGGCGLSILQWVIESSIGHTNRLRSNIPLSSELMRSAKQEDMPPKTVLLLLDTTATLQEQYGQGKEHFKSIL